MKIRISDIAKAAQVSSGVVSTFLQNKNPQTQKNGIRIGHAARERIIKACRNLEYKPDNSEIFAELYPELTDITFALFSGVVNTFENPYFARVLSGILEGMADLPINLNLATYNPHTDYLQQPELLPEAIKKKTSTKLLVAGPLNYSFILSAQQSGASVVYISRRVNLPNIKSVVPDFFHASSMVVKIFFENGHRQIVAAGAAYFTEDEYNYTELRRGLLSGCQEHGIQFSADDIFIRNAAQNTGYLAPMLERKEKPTAVFCFDDSTACAVYQEAQAMGIKIPDELSIIGCNDDGSANMLTPTLTTIHVPMKGIGKASCRAVTDFAQTKHENAVVYPSEVLPVTLKLGDSVARR